MENEERSSDVKKARGKVRRPASPILADLTMLQRSVDRELQEPEESTSEWDHCSQSVQTHPDGWSPNPRGSSVISPERQPPLTDPVELLTEAIRAIMPCYYKDGPRRAAYDGLLHETAERVLPELKALVKQAMDSEISELDGWKS